MYVPNADLAETLATVDPFADVVDAFDDLIANVGQAREIRHLELLAYRGCTGLVFTPERVAEHLERVERLNFLGTCLDLGIFEVHGERDLHAVCAQQPHVIVAASSSRDLREEIPGEERELLVSPVVDRDSAIDEAEDQGDPNEPLAAHHRCGRNSTELRERDGVATQLIRAVSPGSAGGITVSFF